VKLPTSGGLKEDKNGEGRSVDKIVRLGAKVAINEVLFLFRRGFYRSD